MNRKVVLAVVAVLAIAGYAGWKIRQSRAPLEWSGTVEAHTIEVGSRVGGRVAEVKVREGALVKAGEVLLTLEAGDLHAQRLQASGALEQAQSALDKIASKTLPTARRAEIAASQARLDAQEVAVEKAKLDTERMKTLAGGGAATTAESQDTALALRNAVAQRDGLRAQLDQLLHGTPQDVKSAQGAVDVAKGRLDQIDVMLGELSVKAPVDARVETLSLRPGDIVAPNATAARLLEPAELFVRIYVPETQLGKIQPGQKVPIFVDSFAGKAFGGVVEYIASEGEFTPRNLQTADERADQVFASRIRIDEGTTLLRAGMAAFIQVPR